MATTRVFGSDGAVAITGFNYVPNTWSLSVAMAISRVTGYGDSYASKKGGVKDATGSTSGGLKYDASTHTPNIVGATTTGVAAGSFTLTVATGCTYTAAGSVTVIMRNCGIGHVFEGNVTVTYDFEYNGAPTETWDET